MSDEKHAFDNGSGMTDVMTVDEMIAEIQRLGRLCERYHAAVAPPQWQPIETAPKDKTLVLVYRPNSREQIAIRVVRDWCGRACCPIAEPTHWMPLPAPPETT